MLHTVLCYIQRRKNANETGVYFLGFSWFCYGVFVSMGAVEVSIPPAVFSSVVSGKTYAVAGDVWVEVPEGTTFDDLPRYVAYKPREVAPVPGENSWSVKGSKGNVYAVKLSEGVYSCSCPGYGFRRKCRHITEIKNENR